MATVSAQHQWADGSAVAIQVEVEESYPDCVDEARAQAVRGLAEMVATFTGEPDPRPED